MKRYRTLITAVTAISFLCILSASCGGGKQEPTPTPPVSLTTPVPSQQQSAEPVSPPPATVQPTPEETEEPTPPEPTPDLRPPEGVAGAAAANDFSFKLSAELLKSTDGDFAASPLFVWLPLAVLLNASDGDTVPAAMSSLCVGGGGLSDLNLAAGGIIDDLSKPGSGITIGNAIFVSSQYELDPDFAAKYIEFFGGSQQTVNFNSNDTIGLVNTLASGNVSGLIKDAIGSFEPDSATALISSVYLSDTWSDAYSVRSEAGINVISGADIGCYESDEFTAVCLSLSSGNFVYAVLPKGDNSPAGIFDKLSVSSLTSGMAPKSTAVSIPDISIESKRINLFSALGDFGLPFVSREANPLTKLVKNETLFIGQIVHKASVKINAAGATGGAVTISSTVKQAPADYSGEVIEFSNNFVIVITAPTTFGGEQVLFTGVIS